MFELISSFFWFVCDCVFELCVFFIVELIVKEILLQAKNNEEKQTLFVLQASVLFFSCVIIYFHHLPYIIFLLAFLALLNSFTFQNFDLGISRLWRCLSRLWRDHSDYSDYSNSIHGNSFQGNGNSSNAYSPAPTHFFTTTASMVPSTRAPISSSPSSSSRPNFNNCEDEDDFEAEEPLLSKPMPIPTVQSNDTLPRSSISGTHVYQRQTACGFHGGSTPSLPILLPPSTSNNTIRTSIQINPSTTRVFNERPNVRKDLLSKWSARFGSVVSNLWKEYDGSQPPGIINRNNDNVCFISCILQSLSRTPRFTQKLVDFLDKYKLEMTSRSRRDFLSEIVDVFTKLTSSIVDKNNLDDACFYRSPLDLKELRTLMSNDCPSGLVQNPRRMMGGGGGGGQLQQDASELLLWLLNRLNECVRLSTDADANYYTRPAIRNDSNTQQQQQRRQQTTTDVHSEFLELNLSAIRQRYQNPSPSTIILIKQDCLTQIAQADGLNADSYSNPTIELSNLMWLAYKNQNSSIVDDLFTGQSVIAYLCGQCCHLSITTETFRILTIPIPHGKDSVTIRECFAKLVEVEILTHDNRPHCDRCDINNDNAVLSSALPHPLYTSTPNGGQVGGRRTSTSSILRPLSPIVMSSLATLPLSQRQMSVRQLPDCLVVQLLRFGVTTGQQPYKVYTRVEVTSEALDLSPLVVLKDTQDQRFLYKLYAVVLHSGGGSTQSGHYVTYTEDRDSEQWFLFNDNIVKRVHINEELMIREVQENIYLLYYQRIYI